MLVVTPTLLVGILCSCFVLLCTANKLDPGALGGLFCALGGGNARVLLRQLERRWSRKVRGFNFQLANKVFVAPRQDHGALFALLLELLFIFMYF